MRFIKNLLVVVLNNKIIFVLFFIVISIYLCVCFFYLVRGEKVMYIINGGIGIFFNINCFVN